MPEYLGKHQRSQPGDEQVSDASGARREAAGRQVRAEADAAAFRPLAQPHGRGRLSQEFFDSHAQVSDRAAAPLSPGNGDGATFEVAWERPKRSPVVAIIASVVAVAALLGVILGGLAFFGVFNVIDFVQGPKPAVLGSERVEVVIPEGASTSDIARILSKKGVINDEAAFKNAVAAQNAASALKPGTYMLTQGTAVEEIVTALKAGPAANGNKLTIPEGLTLEQTAAVVEASCNIPAAEFITAARSADQYVQDYPFLADVADNSMEGFLYPKTYSIPPSSSADYVIRVLLDQFVIETAQLDLAYATDHNLTFYDIVTIASLIEKETAQDDERALVSSVVYNRLRQGMRLQIDATVVYALGPDYDGHPLLNVDLTVDSPYNTYLVDQLPAGPICSPQIASIQAAAHPDETDFVYYVLTSKEGRHTFCATAEEFEAAKELYMSVFGIS
jgi:UPF0755 protein